MENRKLRILIITSMPWRDDNNIGNSYSNIFRGLENQVEFAHIYCRSGMPQNAICHRYFQINEGELVANIKNRKHKLGKAFYLENPEDTPKEEFSRAYNKMRILRWEIFFLGRSMLWDMADWKNERLDKFVEEFKPDLMFGTLTYMHNINKMMVYLKDKYNIPLYVYAWDDVYSLKQFSLSPFYWIRRFTQRTWIRKCVGKADKMYVITELMRKEYSKYFNRQCDMLYKGYSYENESYVGKKVDPPMQFIFMGNLGAGRCNALAKLVAALKEINSKEKKAELRIYTLSPVSEQMKKGLVVEGTSRIMPVVPNDQVLSILQSADILVHVEPLTLKDRLFYRLSFTTKLVDYFKAGRCVLGFGGKTASLEYLEENDCGIVTYDINSLPTMMRKLVDQPDLVETYAKKAWDCGYKNHQIQAIQEKLISDFEAAKV